LSETRCYVNNRCGEIVTAQDYEISVGFAVCSGRYESTSTASSALEDKLIEELDDVATVDGHDFGSGAFNGGEGEADKSATRQNFFFH
jgi:hypothetical protein